MHFMHPSGSNVLGLYQNMMCALVSSGTTSNEQQTVLDTGQILEVKDTKSRENGQPIWVITG